MSDVITSRLLQCLFQKVIVTLRMRFVSKYDFVKAVCTSSPTPVTTCCQEEKRHEKIKLKQPIKA